MRILADENCDGLLIHELRARGHDVESAGECMLGADDEAVLRRAIAECRVLLTNDLDFGREAELKGLIPRAIILMRLHPLGVEARADRAITFIAAMDGREAGKLFVLEAGQVRERTIAVS
jgi:predicted nuclease of predicted toxin-antitoxin system